MRFAATAVASVAILASSVVAADEDGTILNFALTLEHLEAAFYSKGLSMYSENDFTSAGYKPYVHQRLVEISAEEHTHVSFLTSALKGAGVKPVAACTYNLDITSIADFLALSRVFEGVGVSAYLGAAPLLTAKAYLSAAASIVTVEARHQASISEYLGQSGEPTPFDTALDGNQVFSLVAPFIKSCPSTNPTLPFKAFPSLVLKNGTPAPGARIGFMFAHSSGKKYYAHFLNGDADHVVPVEKLDSINYTNVPKSLTGRVYVMISSSSSSTGLTDANTVAGPLIIDLSDPSQGF